MVSEQPESIAMQSVRTLGRRWGRRRLRGTHFTHVGTLVALAVLSLSKVGRSEDSPAPAGQKSGAADALGLDPATPQVAALPGGMTIMSPGWSLTVCPPLIPAVRFFGSGMVPPVV